MADMIADLKHKVGKSMSRLSTNEPHRVPASVARYEGVFQNVLNEVHAPDIAPDVYVLQGDIVVPSGTGRKIRSVPTLTSAKPNLPSHFLRASNNRTAPCADEPACCMHDVRMRLSLGEPVVAIPDFFAKPSNAPTTASLTDTKPSTE